MIATWFQMLGRPIHARFPVRWSTVVMLVLFVGLGNLFLAVRAPSPASPRVAVVTPTTSAPETLVPSVPTSTAPPSGDGSNSGGSATSVSPSTTIADPPPDSASSTTVTTAGRDALSTTTSAAP